MNSSQNTPNKSGWPQRQVKSPSRRGPDLRDPGLSWNANQPQLRVQLLKPELLLCLQLDLVDDHAAGLDSPRAGVRKVKVLARSSAVTPSQTSGRVRRRELLLLLAEAVATSSDGAHVAETPVIPDPKALAYLKAAACSMLLPRRRATYTLLMVSHGASGEPTGVRRAMRGAFKGSRAQSKQ